MPWVTFPDGKKTGKLSVTPVNADKVPMPPPNGMQPQFIVTIQPVGAKFDPPAKLTLPNVDGHKPGAQVEMYSFDHDLEEFVSIGLGTVSADGSVIASNPGVGVIKAGWHCGSQPGESGCTHNCSDCQSCDGNCNCHWDNSLTPTSLTDIPGDCKKPGCRNGPTQVPDDGDKPKEKCKFCKPGAGEVVDVSGATDPGGVQGFKYQLVENDETPEHWGVTSADFPVVNISAYCAGTVWKARVTQADSTIHESWKLLTHPNAVLEVTSDLIINTNNCQTLTLMESNLNEIANQGRNDANYFYYILEAVHAHENVHVDQYKELMNKYFDVFRLSAEGISIPIEQASDATEAANKFMDTQEYKDARNTLYENHLDAQTKSGDHTPKAPFIEAEHRVVDPKITEISEKEKTTNCR